MSTFTLSCMLTQGQLSGQIQRTSRTTQVALTRLKRLLLETGLLTGEYIPRISTSRPHFKLDSAAIMATVYVYVGLATGAIFTGWNSFVIPGLSLGKIYGNSILVLLNNRFTIPEGRNAHHPEFDIPLYRGSAVALFNTERA